MRGDEAYVYAIIPLYVIILLVAVRALLLGEIAWCRENFG
jgi:hypothetical protein